MKVRALFLLFLMVAASCSSSANYDREQSQTAVTFALENYGPPIEREGVEHPEGRCSALPDSPWSRHSTDDNLGPRIETADGLFVAVMPIAVYGEVLRDRCNLKVLLAWPTDSVDLPEEIDFVTPEGVLTISRGDFLAGIDPDHYGVIEVNGS